MISLIGWLDEGIRRWLCFVTGDENSLLRVARKQDRSDVDCNLAINLNRSVMSAFVPGTYLPRTGKGRSTRAKIYFSGRYRPPTSEGRST